MDGVNWAWYWSRFVCVHIVRLGYGKRLRRDEVEIVTVEVYFSDCRTVLCSFFLSLSPDLLSFSILIFVMFSFRCDIKNAT